MPSRAATLIILSFAALSVWYSLVIPPFETPDEHYHYAFARHLAQGNPLPVQAAEATGPWAQEGSQAPLYYWLVGRLSAGIDQSDFERLRTLNPRANLGDPLFPGNKNRMLYSAADWPLRGANLALHMGRWFSVLLGCITLGALYATARLAFPARKHIAGVALATAAWLPQFVFLSASFTNDTLVIALAALTVWWLARVVVRYGTAHAPPIPWWEWAILGALLGLAGLSKLQGLGLWLLAALVGALIAWRRQDWRVLIWAALPVALPAVGIAGWWYARNIALYGDWTGLEHLATITGARDAPLTWGGWWREFRGLRYSTWGVFGWFNVLLPLWVYWIFDALTLLAIGGGLWSVGVRQKQHPRRWPNWGVQLILGLWCIISSAALLYWISRAEGSQGRLIFPALNALAILFVAGLDVWRRPDVGRRQFGGDVWGIRLLMLVPALLLACTLYAGGRLLPRTYAAPQPIAAVPDSATHVDFSFGPQRALQILAIDVAPGTYVPGDSVPVTLYMQRDAPTDPGDPPATHPAVLDYQVFIQFLDESGAEVGNLTTHPGWGRNPTTLWEAGATYADTYPVRFARPIDPRAPLLARIYVGFVNPATEESGRFPIEAYNAQGEIVDPAIAGHVALYPGQSLEVAALGLDAVGVQFGDVMALVAASAAIDDTTTGDTTTDNADQVNVQLLWEAQATPGEELTAFVHLLDGAGNRLGGYDAAPAPRFPTSYWQPGDRVLSTWSVPLEDGLDQVDWADLQVWVGVYPTASQGTARLPVTGSQGQEIAHEMVRLR